MKSIHTCCRHNDTKEALLAEKRKLSKTNASSCIKKEVMQFQLSSKRVNHLVSQHHEREILSMTKINKIMNCYIASLYKHVSAV